MLPPLIFLLLISLFCPSIAQSPAVTRINCGATNHSSINGLQYLPDENFTSAGTRRAVDFPNLPSPLLSTVRSFPLSVNKKFCYVVPTFRSVNYLIRTTFFYGGVNGPEFPSPPVFDQIIDGTIWQSVNTSEDYKRNASTYYEGVFMSKGKSISVCLGANTLTNSNPFISSLEVVMLANSVYNSTNFTSHGLTLIARHNFGGSNASIRYPEDKFDRIWEPFDGQMEGSNTTSTNTKVGGIWNLPPSALFDTAMTSSSESLSFKWPPLLLPLPNSSYYMAFYFARTEPFISESDAALDVAINNLTYYKNMPLTEDGTAVFSGNWSLGGQTTISLFPAVGSNTAPLINGGEVFNVVTLGRRTHARDVIALIDISNGLKNPPLDWSGDPCVPRQYAWTGVSCAEGDRIRVVAMDLTGLNLSGTLSPSVGMLTALSEILLGNNKLWGPIPDLTTLKLLRRLHLENNTFTGSIPSSFGDKPGLKELFLQNNNLTGAVPTTLSGKGIDLRTEGNPLLER